MEALNNFLDFAGIVISIVFVWATVSSSRSFEGSLFRRYNRLMVLGAIFFGLSFFSEAIGDFLKYPIEVVNLMHHIALITSSVILIFSALSLPKEAIKTSEVVHGLTGL